MTRYKVTAEYVTVRSEEAGLALAALGRQQTLAPSGYLKGVILPESVPQEDIDRLLRHGQVEAIEEPE